jgi:hypothetical protein
MLKKNPKTKVIKRHNYFSGKAVPPQQLMFKIPYFEKAEILMYNDSLFDQG